MTIDPTFAPLAELIPDPTDISEPFWKGLNDKTLRLQRCGKCDTHQHPPERFCYSCGSDSIELATASGGGEVYSFIVVHQPYHAAFRDRIPYVVATVQLDEGPRMLGAIFDVDPNSISIGMRVQARIETVSEQQAALFFEAEVQ